LSVVPANAADNAATVTIKPVRVSFIGAVQDTVSAASVTVATGTLVDGDVTDNQAVITVTLNTAPSAAAVLTIADADRFQQHRTSPWARVQVVLIKNGESYPSPPNGQPYWFLETYSHKGASSCVTFNSLV
jgi:hypothetical protein